MIKIEKQRDINYLIHEIEWRTSELKSFVFEADERGVDLTIDINRAASICGIKVIKDNVNKLEILIRSL